MLSENKTVRKNAEYPNNRIDRCCLSDLKSDTYSNSFSPSDIYSEKITNISSDIVLVPGFVDVHVHLREPGFSYKETIKTGTLAAANGGYAAICTMPNLDPVPDSIEHLERQLEIIRRDACIPVYPYGAITIGENGRELSDMDALAPYVVAFSDDGKGVQNEEIMLAAMKKAKNFTRSLLLTAKTTVLFAVDAFMTGTTPTGIPCPEYAVKANGALLHAILSLSVRADVHTMFAMFRQRSPLILSVRQNLKAST